MERARRRASLPYLDQSIRLGGGLAHADHCCFSSERPRAAWKRSGNRRWQPVANGSAVTRPKRDVSRELAASRNQSQPPDPPYKQEVAGSSPAPPMGARGASIERQERLAADLSLSGNRLTTAALSDRRAT